jgi:hypothetical protein
MYLSIVRVEIIGELGTALAVTRCLLRLLVTGNVVPISPIISTLTMGRYIPDDGDDTFLRNVGPYKSHTA